MIYLYIIIPILLILFARKRIVKPARRGQLERPGKYDNHVLPGLHWIILVAEPRELKQIDPPRDVQEKMIKEVADKNIIKNAQLLIRLEAVEASLRAGRLKSYGLN
ncbi:MAG: hypothetical protein R6W31_12125 [Bacteroidales bacterium]